MQSQSQTMNGAKPFKILETYRPLPGAPDELMTAGGDIRPAWRKFMRHFCDLSEDDIRRRFRRGDQYLKDAGVFYRQFSSEGSQIRSWPYSHVPVLIGEQEWSAICSGLIQRAELLEDVVKDIYGDNNLVSQGLLPPSLIAENKEWLRPLVGVQPASGNFLHFLAFEIGRGPNGDWWVLGDRTQAPAGAGFAIENRVASSRIFTDLFEETNVHRLAGFFIEFLNTLRSLSQGAEDRIGILTPGRLTDTYYEHAYIARYLGVMLLEGEDLAVENGKVMVRTVDGLRPISVLWRRLDATFADPLELAETSQLGTPGLVEAARQGNINLINALGSGILETRALLAFLPKISRTLRDEPLSLPNIATWWCGHEKERLHVLKNAGNMMIGNAFTTSLPFSKDEGTALGVNFSDNPQKLAEQLEAKGQYLVGQEAVSLSTTPVFQDGQLQPRPMTLRCFALRTPNGWTIMPGGYARIGLSEDTQVIDLQRGGVVSDVWIVSQNPVDTPTLVQQDDMSYKRAQLGTLPSRAADNLFWLGRYAERAESLLRLLRAYHIRLSEFEEPNSSILKLLSHQLTVYSATPGPNELDALIGILNAAINSAGQLRDRFSDDGWSALNTLLSEALNAQNGPELSSDDQARAISTLIQQLSAFSGLVQENMYRFTGWRFLSIGRSLERAINTTTSLISFTNPTAPTGSLDLALELGDSAISHRRLYNVATHRRSVLDLLALDPLNPRSVFFQICEIRDQISLLPWAVSDGQMSPLARAVLKAHTELSVQTPESLTIDVLQSIKSHISDLSTEVAKTYFN